MDKLLISINSYNANTGGAIYLKTLFEELKGRGHEVKLICKARKDLSEKSFILGRFEKNFWADLISRFFFSPNFLMIYFLKILSISKKFEEIHFHSSRLIPLALLIKIFANKKVVVHSDNIEYKLSRMLIDSFWEAPIRIFDSILLYFYEKKLFCFVDEVTFITENDEQCLPHSNSSVLPVKIISNIPIEIERIFSKRKTTRKSVIFVANFSYQPNIEAFENIYKVASVLPDVNFRIVGRNARFLNSDLGNIDIYSDVSNSRLENLYLQSHICLSLVSSGGGMKTKVAEAMSYNLPVVATKHSLIGYEKVLDSNLIFEVGDQLNEIEIKENIYSASQLYRDEQNMRLFKEYWEQFENYYKI